MHNPSYTLFPKDICNLSLIVAKLLQNFRPMLIQLRGSSWFRVFLLSSDWIPYKLNLINFLNYPELFGCSTIESLIQIVDFGTGDIVSL